MKNLYLLENIKEEEIANITKDEHAYAVVFDYESHKLLLAHHIEHQTIDDFLNDDERRTIFQFCFSLWKWYDKLDQPDLKFHDVNLLSIIDRNEIHEVLMNIVPKLHVVKKAIERMQPSIIFASDDIYSLFLDSDYKIKPISSSDTNQNNYFTHDKIDISYELGGFSFKIKLDRKKYEWVKRNLEKIICNIFALRKNNQARKKIILIEFNPEVFFDLLKEINRQGFQPILINFRRSAVWSKNSITQLRRSHSLVGLPEDWINREDMMRIREIHSAYVKKIHAVFLKEQSLSGTFVFEGIKFDRQMKASFLRVLNDRLDGYFLGIYLAESLNKSSDVLGIVTLNLSGETEKIFSLIHSKIPLVLLQHAFSNYTQTISYLDVLDDFHLIKNRIAVWGDIVKKYLMDRSVSENRIIVSGSPKHDSLIKLEKKKMNRKMILITPRPIINHVEGMRIELYDRYEKTIDRLLEIIDEKNNVEIVFKLHPQQIRHNEIIAQYIKNKNRNVKILQFKSIKELLVECDLHVNIAPDNFDASTVILEAMILGRPTLNIQLQSTKIEFEFMKDNAVKTINFDSNIREEISDLIFNKKKSNELIENSKNYLKRYISNHGKASQTLIDAIKNFEI